MGEDAARGEEPASEHLSFWREYEGEAVVIRKHSISPDTDDREKIQQTVYLTRGTVSRVIPVPPGLVLEDVEEAVVICDFNVLFAMDSTHPKVSPTIQGERVVRTVEEKFVALSSIEELERVVYADDAWEAFREE